MTGLQPITGLPQRARTQGSNIICLLCMTPASERRWSYSVDLNIRGDGPELKAS